MKLNFYHDRIIFGFLISRNYLFVLIQKEIRFRNKTFDGRKIRLLENLLMTWKSQIETAIQYDKSNAYLLPNT